MSTPQRLTDTCQFCRHHLEAHDFEKVTDRNEPVPCQDCPDGLCRNPSQEPQS